MFKKIIFTLLALTMIFSVTIPESFADDLTVKQTCTHSKITISVHDKDNNPIENSKVHIYSDLRSDKFVDTLLTDSQGNVSFNYTYDTGSVKVSKGGFNDKQIPLVCNSDDNLIPIWVQTIFEYYLNNQMTDLQLISALQYLVANDIIRTPEHNEKIVELTRENNSLKSTVTLLQHMIDSAKLESENDNIVNEESENDNIVNEESQSDSSIVSSKIISCAPTTYGSYIDVKGSLTNNDSIPHDFKMILYGSDSDGNMLDFTEHSEYDVPPSQTVFFDRAIKNLSGIVSCGIQFEGYN